MIAEPSLIRSVLRREPAEDADRVGAPGLGDPDRVEAEPLRLLHEREEVGRVRAGRRVAEAETELHRAADPTMWPVSEWEWDPDTYLAEMADEIPGYEELQEAVAAATAGIRAARVLELGTGTGETALRVRAAQPDAEWVGIDASEAMLARARERLPDADLRLQRLEDELPAGPFDLVVSALAVHHLDGAGKRDLFSRVAARAAARRRIRPGRRGRSRGGRSKGRSTSTG